MDNSRKSCRIKPAFMGGATRHAVNAGENEIYCIRGKIMKQFNLIYHNDEAFVEELGEIRKWRAEHASYTTVFRIYSQDMEQAHIAHVCGILDAEMPDALYFGCTSNANILDGVLTREKIILTCTIYEYETTRAALLQFPFLEENCKEDVRALRQYCEANPWVQAIEMVATIMDMSMKVFCDEMSKLREDIQVFGGGAFNPDMDDETAAVFSKGNGFLAHGIVFLLLGGRDFHVYSRFISGWKPLKRKFRITKAEKSVLYELDGKPAFDVYHKFLNIEKNDKFFSNTLEFPFFMERDGIDILRCPLAVNEDDSFVMSSDMEERDRTACLRRSRDDPAQYPSGRAEDRRFPAAGRPDVFLRGKARVLGRPEYQRGDGAVPQGCADGGFLYAWGVYPHQRKYAEL